MFWIIAVAQEKLISDENCIFSDIGTKRTIVTCENYILES